MNDTPMRRERQARNTISWVARGDPTTRCCGFVCGACPRSGAVRPRCRAGLPRGACLLSTPDPVPVHGPCRVVHRAIHGARYRTGVLLMTDSTSTIHAIAVAAWNGASRTDRPPTPSNREHRGPCRDRRHQGPDLGRPPQRGRPMRRAGHPERRLGFRAIVRAVHTRPHQTHLCQGYGQSPAITLRCAASFAQ